MSITASLAPLDEYLTRADLCGYDLHGPAATEPTVWMALAQHAAGYAERADRAASWLASFQLTDGSVGVTPQTPTPAWPTSLAMLLWQRTDPLKYASAIERAAKWAIAAQGTTLPPDLHIGHNTALVGWSWAANTHSWIEPTAFFVMALRACGYGAHPRTRQGVELLVDRLLPDGGCNYGNTKVLGQYLVDHLQPSGISLWALAGEKVSDPRIERSLEYLARSVHRPTGSASLAFALLALAAWDHAPAGASDLIASAWSRATTLSSPYRRALLCLAARGIEQPLAIGSVTSSA